MNKRVVPNTSPTKNDNGKPVLNEYVEERIDDCVWNQVLRIAEKNVDFKTRLRAFGKPDNEEF